MYRFKHQYSSFNLNHFRMCCLSYMQIRPNNDNSQIKINVTILSSHLLRSWYLIIVWRCSWASNIAKQCLLNKTVSDFNELAFTTGLLTMLIWKRKWQHHFRVAAPQQGNVATLLLKPNDVCIGNFTFACLMLNWCIVESRYRRNYLHLQSFSYLQILQSHIVVWRCMRMMQSMRVDLRWN